MKNKTNFPHHAFALLCGMAFVFAGSAFGQAPWVVDAPKSQAVPEGGTAVLSISVTGELPITYTWHRNFELTNYYEVTLDSTNCTLILTNMTAEQACFFNLNTQNAYGPGPGKQVVVAVISSGMETNGFALTVRGITNSVWQIDCTTNLQLADWFTITNFSPAGSPPVFEFVDLEATNLNRFYRVIPTVY